MSATNVSKTPDSQTTSADRIEHLAHTPTNFSMSPELFEKIYLNIKTPRSHKSENRFANASPLGFLGLVICTLTFSMVLMGWGGSGNLNALAGMFIFTGPVLMFISTLFLWIQSQFFPMMVCAMFTVFWLSFGMLEIPSLGLAASYAAPDSIGTPVSLAIEGAASKEYNAAVALYLIVWGLVIITFLIFACRLNVVLVNIFLATVIACFVLAGSYWNVGVGNFAVAKRCQKTGGALIFIVALHGWYMLFVMMAAEMRLTINLPVGDLSHHWSNADVELAQLENEKRE